MSFVTIAVCVFLVVFIILESYNDGYMAIMARIEASWAAYQSAVAWLIADRVLLEEEYEQIKHTDGAVFNLLKQSRLLRQHEALFAICQARQKELVAKSRSWVVVVYEGLFI